MERDLEAGRPLYQPPPSPSFNFNNITVNNTYGPSGYSKPAEPEPDNEDEASELQPQYSQLPQAQRFLSAQQVSKHYQEFQVGLGFYPQGQDPPFCDNYRSHKNIALRPIVYTCHQCIPFKARFICKKCAQKEIADDQGLHRPDHRLRQWQPTWGLNFPHEIKQTPVLSPEMDDFDSPDDLRALTFESREYYDDRAIRFFLPAPKGLCHVVMFIQVHPIKNEKRRLDIWDKAKGMLKFVGMSEIFGNIGASAHSWPLAEPPIAPRKSVDPEPPEKPKKGAIASSNRLNLRRGDDFHKPYMLDVYVNAGGNEENGIEIVLQDEFYESDEFYDRPFRWTLQSISITHIPALAPSFASMAQMEHYRQVQTIAQKEERDRTNKERAERDQERKDRADAMREERERRREEEEERLHAEAQAQASATAAVTAHNIANSQHHQYQRPRPVSMPPARDRPASNTGAAPYHPSHDHAYGLHPDDAARIHDYNHASVRPTRHDDRLGARPAAPMNTHSDFGALPLRQHGSGRSSGGRSGAGSGHASPSLSHSRPHSPSQSHPHSASGSPSRPDGGRIRPSANTTHDYHSYHSDSRPSAPPASSTRRDRDRLTPMDAFGGTRPGHTGRRSTSPNWRTGNGSGTGSGTSSAGMGGRTSASPTGRRTGRSGGSSTSASKTRLGGSSPSPRPGRVRVKARR